MIKTKKTLFALSLWSAMAMTAFAQGTAFTYQGQLSSGGSPANGTYDVQFTLFSVSSGGSAIGLPAVKTGLGITNGLFATALDFGTVFNGTTNWLELAVRTNGASTFSPPLTPRQQLTPTPYAVYAESANASNLVGTIPAANLSGAALLAGGNAFTGVQTVTGGNSSGGAPSLIISGPGGPEVSYTSTTGGLGWDLYAANNGYSISRHGIDFPFQIDGVSGNSLFSHNVGIGTTTPNSDSSLQVNGLVRMGSETGTTEAPTKSILLRRINSSATATGTVVARSLTAGAGVITLERDGTAGGLILKATGSAADAQIVGFGINTSNAIVTTQSFFYGGSSASYQVFTDAQKISYLRLSFGDAANPSDFTTVEAMRAVDNFGNNLTSWIGTVTSTVNQ